MIDLPSPAWARMQEKVVRFAPEPLNLCISGENGAGKGIVAELAHEESPRKADPLHRLTITELNPSVVESELFGVARGAFTGAVARPGRIEAAGDSTLFIDEIGDASTAVQSKLLSVLENREVYRVGGTQPRRVGCRFVFATNRNLKAMVARGEFRIDLYYRITQLFVRVPPLRERDADIMPLAIFFAAELPGYKEHDQGKTFHGEVWELLLKHDWPGNVRQLRNVIHQAVIACDGKEILPKHIEFEDGNMWPEDRLLQGQPDHRDFALEERVRKLEGIITSIPSNFRTPAKLRREAAVSLARTGAISTESLREVLEGLGLSVSPATLSRDLTQLVVEGSLRRISTGKTALWALKP